MKLGIIGMGRRMAGMFGEFRKIAPELQIAGIIDPNPEKALSSLPEEERAGIRFYDSVDALVREAKPDALAIGTRCDLHTGYACQVEKYNLPLFLEKPVAINMEQAVALETAYANSECPVLISFPLRASILCARTRQELEKGAVGRIEHLLAQNYVTYGNVYFDTWHRDYAVTQGLFLQKATHDFDYLSYLAGAPIVRVAAMASTGRVYRDTKTLVGNPDPYSYYLPEVGTPQEGMNEDSSSALIEFANGVKGVYTQVFYSKNYPYRGVKVSGQRGIIAFNWYKNEITLNHHQSKFIDTFAVNGGDEHFGGDVVLSRNFINMIRSGEKSIAPMSTGIESAYACLAAKESCEKGIFVDVRQLGGC